MRHFCLFFRDIYRAEKYRYLRIMRIIIANQNEEPADDGLVAQISYRELLTLEKILQKAVNTFKL